MTYHLYLDEAQTYLNDDAAAMLDQCLKTGLQLTLIHHHRDQFADNRKLLGSIEKNCRVKVVFGGMSVEEAKHYAEEFFLSEVNVRKEKERFFAYLTTGHVRVPFENEVSNDGDSWNVSDALGDSSGGTSSFGTVTGIRLEPVIERMTTGVQDYTRDEKISMIAERFMRLRTGEFIINTPSGTYSGFTPWLTRYWTSDDTALQFEQTLHEGSLPAADVDRRLLEEESAYLARFTHDKPNRTGRKNNRPLPPK